MTAGEAPPPEGNRIIKKLHQATREGLFPVVAGEWNEARRPIPSPRAVDPCLSRRAHQLADLALDLLEVRLAQPLAHDPPFGIDEEHGRDGPDVEDGPGRGLRGIEEDGIDELFLRGELAGLALLLVDRDADDGEALGGVLLMKLLELGHGRDAGGAPS